MATPRDFDDVFRSSYARLVAEIALFTGDRSGAEDVVQEAMARAYASWTRVGALDVPEAWVRKVAHRLAISRWRRSTKGASVLRDRAVQQRLSPAPESSGEVVDLLRSLDARERQVVVLHYLLDLPVDEVGRWLRIPTGTVKSRLHRARRALKLSIDGDVDE